MIFAQVGQSFLQEKKTRVPKNVFLKVVVELHRDFPETNWSDGTTLVKAFFNRTYHLRTGSVTLDRVGERILGIKLLQMDGSRTYLRV